jgi:hypothetical protein
MTKEMTMRALTIAIAAAALVAAAVPADAASKPKADKSCLSVSVGSRQSPGKGNGNGNASDDEKEFESGVTQFSATQVTDIEFAIVFSQTVAAQFTNAQVVEFRVYTPQGNLYETISIPITNNPARAGEKHRIAGYPDLIPVQVLTSINHGGGRGMFAKVTLPVAGTPIISNSLYGTWKAEAVVEDEIAPCSLPAQFTITQ